VVLNKEKWSVVHIFQGENYLCCGPFDRLTGEPAEYIYFSCERCANLTRDILNVGETNANSRKPV
jgi:hypothetical protein